MNTDHTALAAAHAQRAEAHAKLEAAAQALARAQGIANAAQGELDAAIRVESDANDAHAARLSHAITAGAETASPTLTIDDRPRRTAQMRPAIASKALNDLTAQHAQRQAELTAADSAVGQAENAIITQRLLAMAHEAERHISDALAIADELHDLTMSLEVHERAEVARSLPILDIQQLLQRLRPLGNDLKTPTDRLRGIASPKTPWAERRAALLAGDHAITSDAAAA
jgi:hypothetical protein